MQRPTILPALLLASLHVLSSCSSVKQDAGLSYTKFDPEKYETQTLSCGELDRYLRSVDAIRWSMREDGIGLETDFQQLMQLSVASAGAIAIAVPVVRAGVPDPSVVTLPYAIAYSDADKLKRADALIIGLLAKREQLNCAPHPDCAIASGKANTLTRLRKVREQVESGDIAEQHGLDAVSGLLDHLCPVGHRFDTSTR